MADQKITQLTADTSPTTDDLVVTVNDPTGTPANRKVTVGNLLNAGLFNNPYKFSVRRNAAWNLPASAFAAIPFDTELFDSNNNYTSNTYTAPLSGFYQFNGRVSGNGQNQLLLALYINGSVYHRGQHSAGVNGVVGVVYSELVQLTASDTVVLQVFSDTANAAEVTAGSQAYFSGFLVSVT